MSVPLKVSSFRGDPMATSIAFVPLRFATAIVTAGSAAEARD